MNLKLSVLEYNILLSRTHVKRKYLLDIYIVTLDLVAIESDYLNGNDIDLNLLIC